jgi:site-specific DNA recombinase
VEAKWAEEGDKMKAAIYARVSTKEQKEGGSSLETQVDVCLKKARDLGYEIPNEFIFREGYSGISFNRPEYNKLMEVARRGSIEGVI